MNERVNRELAEIQSDAMEKVIRLADKHGIDRDNLFKIFALTLNRLSHIATLADYKFGGNEN